MAVSCAITPEEKTASRIAPLFWQHGEPPALLRREMQAMASVGIDQCVVESRPHPDYLGPGWWDTLDTIIVEAQRLGMRIWLCDDGAYPSGHGGNDDRGKIIEKYPHLTKLYLTQRLMDARGPQSGTFLRVSAWVEKDEELVAVLAARRPSAESDEIDASTIVDLTDSVRDGLADWDVPEGWWRVFVLVRTRRGGEEWTRNYANPLLPEAIDAFIREVYQTHYDRYADHFGKTIVGFFTDEPRFGNAGTYEAVLGKLPMVLPWSDDLLTELGEGWGGSFRAALPTLWNDAGELSARARFRYMNVVSRRFGANYSGRIGRWCEEHGVKLIGHIVEDSNAHARLGYGPGHFFRSLAGQDMSGFDMVFQVVPHFTEGRAATGIGPRLDLEFFYWGLGVLARSLTRLDETKHGDTMCEIFGAGGWQVGLTEMKWLTDHACARGANFLMPHAFSPRFPDPDCPPHFFAGGNNPQWRHFGLWSDYASRVCHLLSGGGHVAQVAVLYHAEAEWAGETEHFQRAVAVLAKWQIDCDVVPIDMLTDEKVTRIGEGFFKINSQRLSCLIIPRAERLPGACLEKLWQFTQAGVKVIFTGELPLAIDLREAAERAIESLRNSEHVLICPVERLAELPEINQCASARSEKQLDLLRITHYRRKRVDLLFCVNEDMRTPLETTLKIPQSRAPLAYDATTDRLWKMPFERVGDKVRVTLTLSPSGSLFIVFAESTEGLVIGQAPCRKTPGLAKISGPWRVSPNPACQAGGFGEPILVDDLSQVSRRANLRRFSGIIRYETAFALPAGVRNACVELDDVHGAAEVFVDGESIGARICEPYEFALENVTPGQHQLRVEVATTLAGLLGDNGLDRTMPQAVPGIGDCRLTI